MKKLIIIVALIIFGALCTYATTRNVPVVDLVRDTQAKSSQVQNMVRQEAASSSGDAVLWDAGGDAILWDAGGDKILWD